MLDASLEGVLEIEGDAEDSGSSVVEMVVGDGFTEGVVETRVVVVELMTVDASQERSKRGLSEPEPTIPKLGFGVVGVAS